jgi:hypothetical protein
VAKRGGNGGEAHWRDHRVDLFLVERRATADHPLRIVGDAHPQLAAGAEHHRELALLFERREPVHLEHHLLTREELDRRERRLDRR